MNSRMMDYEPAGLSAAFFPQSPSPRQDPPAENQFDAYTPPDPADYRRR